MPPKGELPPALGVNTGVVLPGEAEVPGDAQGKRH